MPTAKHILIPTTITRPTTAALVRFFSLAFLLGSTCACSARTEPRTFHVSAQRGDSAGDGSAERPFARIQPAVDRAGPGDTVLIDDGIYRETIKIRRGGTPGQPLTLAAAPGKTPAVRGTEPFITEWQTDTHAGRRYHHALLPASLFTGYEHPWADIITGPTNPFHTKILVSHVYAKRQTDLRARPWAPRDLASAVNDQKDAVTFDTDDRRIVYDGPPGTLPKTLGQVFLDDAPLRQAANLDDLMASTRAFLVSADGHRLLLHLPPGDTPADHAIEITTRAQCLVPVARGIDHVVVRGITFERAANQGPFPQAGIVSTRSGSHWLIERCVIRDATTIGVDCGGETYEVEHDTGVVGGRRLTDNNIIRDCIISDNGLSGIASYGTNNLLIQNNRIERNSRIGFVPGVNASWWELAAIKLHISRGARIEGNLVRDNEAFGIWLDTGYEDCRITRNTLLNNKLAGIFGEASYGPLLIDNNIVAYTRSGHGIYMHDGSDVHMLHNLVFRNAGAGFFLRNVRPLDVKYETSNNVIHGNLILGNYFAGVALPLPDKKNRNNHSDWNVISGGTHFYDNGPVEMIVHSRQRDFPRASSFLAGFPHDTTTSHMTWKDEDVLRVDLPTWQKISGHDRHSIAPFTLNDPYQALRSRELSFELTIPDSLADYLLPETPPEYVRAALAKLDQDFSGLRVSGPWRHPGPFQALRTGQISFPIDPLNTPNP